MVTYKASALLRFKSGTEMEMTIHHYREEAEAQQACKNYSYAGAKVLKTWVEEQEIGEAAAIGSTSAKKTEKEG